MPQQVPATAAACRQLTGVGRVALHMNSSPNLAGLGQHLSHAALRHLEAGRATSNVQRIEQTEHEPQDEFEIEEKEILVRGSQADATGVGQVALRHSCLGAAVNPSRRCHVLFPHPSAACAPPVRRRSSVRHVADACAAAARDGLRVQGQTGAAVGAGCGSPL